MASYPILLLTLLLPLLDYVVNVHHLFLIIMPLIAEIWLLGYLLFIGVKTVKPTKRILPAAIAMPGAQA